MWSIAQEANAPWLAHLGELTAQFPYAKTIARPGVAGMALYSRLPIVHAEVLDLGQPQRPGLLVQLRLGGGRLSLLTMHPRPPLRTQAFGERNAQLVAAASVMQTLPTPRILVGDLNSSLWSPYYARLVRDTGLSDARKGFGVLPTWPARLSWLAIPIDQCLVSADITVVQMRTGPNTGSDHLPVIVDLVVPEPQSAASAHTCSAQGR